MTQNYENQKPGKSGKKSMLRVILKTFRFQYTLSFVLGVIQTFLDLISPYLIKKLIEFLETPNADNKQGYILVAYILGSQSFSYMLGQHTQFYVSNVGETVMSVLTAMIFAKQLRMTPSTRKNYG